MQQPNSGLDRFTVEVSRTHTIRHTHSRYDSSERVISSSQRPLPKHHTAHTTDKYTCPQRDSSRRFQQSSSCRCMPYTARPQPSAMYIIMFCDDTSVKANNRLICYRNFRNLFNLLSSVSPFLPLPPHCYSCPLSYTVFFVLKSVSAYRCKHTEVAQSVRQPRCSLGDTDCSFL
jgi:hypothetical protein